MDRNHGGTFSYLIESTKSKLFVLSSLLGVGAIYYMTKNYLQNGHFFPSWYGSSDQGMTSLTEEHVKRHKVIGGKGHVVIKEEMNTTVINDLSQIYGDSTNRTNKKQVIHENKYSKEKFQDFAVLKAKVQELKS